MINKATQFGRKQLKKLFSKLFSKDKAGQFVQPVMHAAQARSYIETVSCKADALHLAIKQLYEEDLQAGFKEIMKKIAPLFRKGKVRLAVDKHEIGYYGKEEGIYIVGTAYDNKSDSKAFEYITISLLTGNKDERIHLYGIPWHIGQDTVQSVATLIDVVMPWIGKVEVIEFDRGFHNNELIHWLNLRRLPYLIHIPKRKGKIAELIQKTKSFWKGKYQTVFNKNKTKTKIETNLYVCKNIQKKDWVFVSCIWFRTKWEIRNLYRNRWQIETNYAVKNQNRVMSKSTDYMIRYFYFLCDIIIQVFWRVGGICQIPFKAFLRLFVVGVEQVVEMKPAYLKPPPKG